MGKTNWSRVFLGGLLAGVVLIVLGFAAWAIYLERLWSPAMEALGHPANMSAGGYAFSIIFSLVIGILAVWLYSAIRPRYGAGAKTAVIAGIAFWILSSLIAAISLGSMGLFKASLLVIDSLTGLVISVVATLVGAWVYKEQTQ
jgi:hypothetical protein